MDKNLIYFLIIITFMKQKINKGKRKSSFSKAKHSGKNQTGTIRKDHFGSKRTRNVAKKPRTQLSQEKKGKKSSGIFKNTQSQATHKAERHNLKEKRKEEDRLNKIIILEESKKGSPDREKIRTHLSEIKSRGLRQRLKIKMSSLLD